MEEVCSFCSGYGYNVHFDVGFGDSQVECEPCKSTGKIFKEPQLNHLLVTIGEKQRVKPKIDLWNVQIEFYEIGNEKNNAMYHLQKSLEDNLEDPVLCEFIYSIIK